MSESSYWDRIGRRRLPRRSVLWGIGLGAAGLGLGACATQTPASPTGVVAAPATPTAAAAAPAPTPAPTAVPTPAVKRGGTLRIIAGTSEYPNLDVHQTASFFLLSGGPAIAYSQLLRFKAGKDVPRINYLVAPDAAISWDQPDETTYVFKLRPGVKYQNIAPVNGRDLVAQDVVKSFERQIAFKVNAGLLQGLDKMEAVDKSTVRLQLSAPNADFLWGIASNNCKIVPPETWDLKGDLKEGPIIGSSAFIFESAEKGSLVTMARNPDYFEKGLPYLDKVQLFRIPDATAILNAFRTHNADAGQTGFTPKDVEALVKQNPAIQAQRISGGSRYMFVFKSDRPPFNDIRVRQALSKGINRQELIETVYGKGDARLTSGVTLASQDLEIPDAELQKTLAYDPERAKQLLKDAGYDKGLTIDVPYSNLLAGLVTQAAELTAAQLQKIGVTLKLRSLDGPTFNDAIYTRGEYEGAYFGLKVNGAAPTNSDLLTMYHSKGLEHTTKLANPDLDKLIEQQAVMAKDVEGRKKLLLDIQRRIIDESAINHLMMTTLTWVVWPEVRDFYPNALIDATSTLAPAWLDK